MFDILKMLIGSGILGFIIWLYKKQPSFNLRFDYGSNGLLLTISNTRDIDITIKHVQLVRRISLFKYHISETPFYSLVGAPYINIMHPSQHDEINIEIKSKSTPIKFEIDFNNMFNLYDYFINWAEYPKIPTLKILANPIHLPTCYIQVVITHGKKKIIRVPDLFYFQYKKHISSQMNKDLNMLDPFSKLRFVNTSPEHYDLILDAYEAAKKTSYLMFR